MDEKMRRDMFPGGSEYYCAEQPKIADDLNRVLLRDADGPTEIDPYSHYSGSPQENFGVEDKDITVHFKNIEDELIRFIKEQDHHAFIGCVAWLTNLRVLAAFGLKPVSLIVQKEDFLRPDTNAFGNWKHCLRDAYKALRTTDARVLNIPYCYGGSVSDDAVRCVGVINSNRAQAAPRMHNKFLVAGKFITNIETMPDGYVSTSLEFQPTAIWTGSFNFTVNATKSLENAVVIKNPIIAQAFHKEWIQIYGISEELDWQTEWVCPSYRIGT